MFENTNDGIFAMSLSMIEILMESNEEKVTTQRVRRPIALTFNAWEEDEINYEKAKILTRDDKIDRIFIVLQYLIKIMECDLSIWILKNNSNILEHINDIDKRPIIVDGVWGNDGNSGCLNTKSKQILSIFVKSIILKFPYDKVKILSVSLIL